MSIVDERARDSLSREIYLKRRADVGTTIASSSVDDTEDEDIIGYDAIEPGLPPASSDRRKWWLDNGLPARSSVRPPERGAALNPNRPSNPFPATDEPDWVHVSQPVRTESFQSNVSSLVGSDRRSGLVTPRKLPPPFEPANSPSSNNIHGSTLTKAQSIPTTTSPSMRRPSSSSSQTSTLKKQPPPIARKPVHLTASVTSSSPTTPKPDLNGMPNSVLRISSISMNGVQTKFPPPPKRAIGGVEGGKAQTPPAQPRRMANNSASKTTEVQPGSSLPSKPVDLLGDDQDASLKGWEVLKPSSS